MAISLSKNYVNLLDEVYKKNSLTSVLTGDPTLLRNGGSAKEILYPQISVSGLGDYDRNSGYTGGTVDLVWKTATYNYDRGTKISVDAMDNAETFDIAFGMAGAELIRTKVAPETDAFTFATIASATGISKATPSTFADAQAFLTAVINAKNKMDEDEVPQEDRVLFATVTLLNSVMALETTKSREVLNSFSQCIGVPQSRFYTEINLLDGKTTGEEAGHFKKAASGKDINFLIVHKPAIIKHDKHVVSDIIDPANNIDADSYILKYRKYALVDVFANKTSGVYISHKA